MLKKRADMILDFKNGEANFDSISYIPMMQSMDIQIEMNFETEMLCLQLAGIETVNLLTSTSKYVSQIQISTLSSTLRLVKISMMNGEDKLEVTCNRLYYTTINDPK